MKILFSHSLSDGGTVQFSAVVVAQRISDRAPLIAVSQRVASMPFPPFGGKRKVWLKPELASKIVADEKISTWYLNH